jgi:hypothetical protein
MKPSQSTTTEQHLIQNNAKAGLSPRIEWLDVARGLCMLLIIYDHSDSYFTLLNPLLPYNWYVANVLCAFVFISGYLLPTHTQLVVSKKIKSIFRSLVVPYLFFSTLFTFPKAFIHEQDVSLSESIFNILSGQSSWFICALVVAELLFVGLVQLFKDNKIAVFIVSLVCFILAKLCPEPNNNYWSAVQALIFMPFLCMGWLAKQRSLAISTKVFALVSALFIALKVVGTQININEVIAPLFINHPLIFMIDMMVGIAIIIFIAQKINRNIFLEHVGKHSLICYFLCGGIPLLFTKLFEKIGLGFNNAPYLLPLIFLFSTFIIVVAATLIQKYLGFLWSSKRKQ